MMDNILLILVTGFILTVILEKILLPRLRDKIKDMEAEVEKRKGDKL